VELSDYVRSLAAGGYGVVGGLAGAAEYAIKPEPDNELSDIREWARQGAEGQAERMSPAAQRAMRATVLPGDGETIWGSGVSTSNAIGLRAAQAVPSLLASIIPGGLAARIASSAGAGVAAGGAAAGALSGGDVFNQISDELTKTPDEQLQRESETYRGLRGMGMDEAVAKSMLTQEAAGYKPLIMAAITALTSRYGVEGLVAHRAAGQAGRGVLRGTALGALGEAAQEGIEGASGELLAQEGVFDAKGGAGDHDWRKALEAAASGALVGGVLGGGVGAITAQAAPGRPVVEDRQIDVDNAAALSPEPLPPVTPPGNGAMAPDAGPEVTLDQKRTTPGQELDALDKTVKAGGANAGVVEQVTKAAPVAPDVLAPDVAAALVYDPELGGSTEEFIPDDDIEPLDPAPPVPAVPSVPVVTPQMAAAIGAGEPAAAAVPPPVQPAEPPLPEEATPPAPVGGPPVAPLVEPAAPALAEGTRTITGDMLKAVHSTAAGFDMAAAGDAVRQEVKDALAAGRPVQYVVEGKPRTISSVSRLGLVDEDGNPWGIGQLVMPSPGDQSRIEIGPARRVLEDVKAPKKEQALVIDAAGNLKVEAKGPSRMGRRKKEQIEAGAEKILSAKDLDRQKRQEELAGLAERVRAAQAQFPVAPTLEAPTPQLRAYARQLVELAQVGDIKLANLKTDADPALRLIRDAIAIGKGQGTVSRVRDFVVTDTGLRQGGGEEFTKSHTEGGVALRDEKGEAPAPRGTTTAGAVENAPEEEVVDEIDAKRAAARQAELDAAEVARKAEVAAKAAAAMEGAVIGGAKRVAVVETRKKRTILTPQERAAITRRGNQAAAGTATATTPAEAREQLVAQAREDAPLDVPLAREAVEAEAPVTEGLVYRTGALKDAIRGLMLDANLTGVHKLMMTEAANRIRKLAGDVRVHVLDPVSFQDAAKEHFFSGRDTSKVRAFYTSQTDEIFVDIDHLNAEIIIHEGLHAAYHRAIDTNEDARTFIGHLMNAVRAQLAEEARAAGETKYRVPYGLTNPHEFISEAFSNRAFVEILERTQFDVIADILVGNRLSRASQRMSAWDALILGIKKALFGKGGPPRTVLEQIVRVAQALDETTQRQGRMNPLTAFPMEVSETVQTLQNESRYLGAAAESWWRRTGLWAGTVDQIVRTMRPAFEGARGEGNPLDRIYEALSKQAVYVDNKRKDGEAIAQGWLQLIEQHGRDVMGRAAGVWIDATMANVNLGPNADNSHLGKDVARNYQNKAQLARLEQQFAALPTDVQKYILDSATYYRDMQNEMTKALVGNILRSLAPGDISPQAYAQLFNNTLNGTLTEDDAGILDNPTLFNALRDSGELRVVKGIYVPLMRHGKKVVRTRARLGDLHGGQIVETDKHGNVIIEWRAPKDAAARVQYKAFAESTGAKITSVGKRRYLPDGTIVSAEDAKGQKHEVAYRARVQRRGLQMFDTGREAARWIEENRGEFEWTDSKALDRQEAEQGGDLTNTQLASIISVIDKRTDIDAGFKQVLKNAAKEASVRLMAGNRIQQRSLPRRNVAGASQDIARNTVQYATAASNYLGKLRYMPTVRDALEDMRRLIADQPESKFMQARNQVLNELVARIDRNVINPREQHPWVRLALTLSFMDKLFSPMYLAVNSLQPNMFTVPVLTGHYGALRSMAAVNRAYRAVGAHTVLGGGLANTGEAIRHFNKFGLDTSDLIGSIRKRVAAEPDGVALTELINELQATGQLGSEAGFELAASISAGAGKTRMAIAKAERIARQMMIAVEDINRSVSAVAAYRLGRSSGMTEEQAIAHAKDIIDRSQFNYAAFNQPRFFSHPLAAPALQFKKFAQNVTALLVDMVRKAGFGTPHEKRIAWGQIGALLTVQMAMAGAMGLPGLELLKTGFVIASMLGLSDGWDDQERKWRKWFAETVGKTPEELINKGILARGIAQFIPFPDLSSRVSMSDMWLFGEPKSGDREGAEAYMFRLLGGAPASLMLDWADAGQHAADGDLGKAFIKAVPAKFVADTAKAVTQRVNRDITTSEAFIQAAGARSARMAEEGEKTGANIAIGKKLEEERKRLQRQYLEAGSSSELLKIRARIVIHNKQADEVKRTRQKIGTKALDAIRADKEKRRAALQGD
jgi:hypothetical protein